VRVGNRMAKKKNLWLKKGSLCRAGGLGRPPKEKIFASWGKDASKNAYTVGTSQGKLRGTTGKNGISQESGGDSS